jgi:signal transduction histidine kinase
MRPPHEHAEQPHQFLAEAGRALSRSLDYDTTVRTLARLIVPALADWCTIWSVTGEADQQHLEPVVIAHVDPEKEPVLAALHREAGEFASPESGVNRVLRTGQPDLAAEISDEHLHHLARNPEWLRLLLLLRPRSHVMTPLRARGRIIGILALVVSDSDRRYGPDDLTLAEEVARLAAFALDNARLYAAEQAARRAAEQAASRTARLQRVTATLSGAITPAQVLDTIMSAGQEAMGAVSSTVRFVSDDGQWLDRVGGGELAPAVASRWQRVAIDAPLPSATAVRTRQPVLLRSHRELERDYPVVAASLAPHRQGAQAILPLLIEGRAIGSLALQFAADRAFPDEDVTFLLTIADLCTQALARARLYEAEQQARAAAERLARLREQFVTDAAHELRTPLTSLKGFTQMLSQQMRVGGNQAALINLDGHVQMQVARLERLVANLLDAARLQQGRLPLTLAPVDLASLARQVLARFHYAAERTSRHRLVLDAPEPVVGQWDDSQLDQVLTNLISNALKYSPAGGEVRLQVCRAGSSAEVVVSDQGVGIAPADQASLFQPFARGGVGGGIPGVGLGLYISAQVVERHGGTIMVASTPGQGTAMVVRLPLVPRPA